MSFFVTSLIQTKHILSLHLALQAMLFKLCGSFKTNVEMNVEYAEKRGRASDGCSAAELRNQTKKSNGDMHINDAKYIRKKLRDWPGLMYKK
jgi:hypothetical protein